MEAIVGFRADDESVETDSQASEGEDLLKVMKDHIEELQAVGIVLYSYIPGPLKDEQGETKWVPLQGGLLHVHKPRVPMFSACGAGNGGNSCRCAANADAHQGGVHFKMLRKRLATSLVPPFTNTNSAPFHHPQNCTLLRMVSEAGKQLATPWAAEPLRGLLRAFAIEAGAEHNPGTNELVCKGRVGFCLVIPVFSFITH